MHKIIEKHSKELGGSTHLRGENKQILKYQFSLIPRITECCMASQNTMCPLVKKSHMSEIWDVTITKKKNPDQKTKFQIGCMRFNVPLGNFLFL